MPSIPINQYRNQHMKRKRLKESVPCLLPFDTPEFVGLGCVCSLLMKSKAVDATATAITQPQTHHVQFNLLLLQAIQYVFVSGVKSGKLILYRR